jgi:hypothetical protein
MCVAPSIVVKDVFLESYLVAEALRVRVYGRPKGFEGSLGVSRGDYRQHVSIPRAK